MTPSEPDLKRICAEALDHAAGPGRAAYLDEMCAGDARLRLQVEMLLKTHDEDGGLLGTATSEPTAALASLRHALRDQLPESEDDATSSVHGRSIAEGPGTTIGPYKLLQEIGEGGMGAVFMAEQEKPIRRKVALKVIKPGMDTRQVIARFEAERQALAMMEHPNISKVLDAGATDSGRPFFVMELVDGIPITDFCDENHLTPRERLELFVPVCQAIQHAHQKGIVHRDIKPSNVLVTLVDGKPTPKVIDFGIAKAIDQRLTERTVFTEFGAVIGTLEYMSPEQAEMGALDIDTRSDVYSLGVLLYELLTGSTPLDRTSLHNAGYPEILRRIREEEPAKPSTRLSESRDALPSISVRRKVEPARLARLVRGDLDWIVMKALEKDRTRRYETASGFARDVQRYLDGDPVEASPPSRSYKFRKLARKHRAALATAGAFAFLLVAATAVSAGLAVWANNERSRAQDREQTAIDAVRRFGDVVRENPELKRAPELSNLRATLLNEPIEFFQNLRERLQAEQSTTADSLARLASASFDLGKLIAEIGDKQDALKAYEESLSIRERLESASPSDVQGQGGLAATLGRIGLLQKEIGRPLESLASYERSRAILERLVAADPSVSEYQLDLAATLNHIGLLQNEMGRPSEALAWYERSRALHERLADANPSIPRCQLGLASTLNQTGAVQHATGRLAEALASYELAHAILERLAAADPSDFENQRDLATTLNNIGVLQYATGRPAEALASYKLAHAIFERLVAADPSVSKDQKFLASSFYNIGGLQNEMGRPSEALDSYEQSRAIHERLAAANPSVSEYQLDLAATLNQIGGLQNEMGHPLEALGWCEQSRAIQERLAAANPSVSGYQKGLAGSLTLIGLLQYEMGHPSEALASFERSLAIQERLANAHPELVDFASGVGGMLNNLALIDLDERRFDEAKARLTSAIEWQRKALAINPRHPSYRQFLTNHLNNLIRATEGLGQAAEAAEARRELVEVAAGDPTKADLDARLAAVVEGQPPEDGDERIQLAGRAYERGLHAASARLFAEAFADDPKLGDDRNGQHAYNAACAAALAAAGKGKDDPPPDEDAKIRLRGQARDWLRADLEAWTKLLETGDADVKATIVPTLQRLKQDADLAGVRDEQELAKLTEAERAGFKQLWSDVDRLIAKAAGGK